MISNIFLSVFAIAFVVGGWNLWRAAHETGTGSIGVFCMWGFITLVALVGTVGAVLIKLTSSTD